MVLNTVSTIKDHTLATSVRIPRIRTICVVVTIQKRYGVHVVFVIQRQQPSCWADKNVGDVLERVNVRILVVPVLLVFAVTSRPK